MFLIFVQVSSIGRDVAVLL